MQNPSVQRMTRIAMLAALLCILAPVSIPLPFGVPISLGSLCVMLAGMVLGSLDGLFTVLIYLILGMLGLPVFAGYHGGISVLAGLTGGFLAGYVPLVLCAGAAQGKSWKQAVLFLLAGNFLLYLTGILWFLWASGSPLSKAITACVLPFLPGDALKIFCVIKLAGSLAALHLSPSFSSKKGV
jgi:biotin transport system substrate-specific component